MKTVDAAPLRSLVYYLTEACNLRCGYCYVEKSGRRSSLEVGRAAIDFLVERGGTDLHLRFFGGEPMLEMERIEELVAYGNRRAAAAGKTLRFDMVTNATLADGPRVERLRSLGVEAVASADGTPRAMMEQRPHHGGRGGGEELERCLRRLLAAGVAVAVRMTVLPGRERFADDLRYLLALEPPSLMMTTAQHVAWREAEMAAVYEAVAEVYLAAARRRGPPPLVLTNRLLVRHHAAAGGHPLPLPSRFCAAGAGMLGVDVAGNLYPCHRFVQLGAEQRVGSVQSGEVAPESMLPALARRECRGCTARIHCAGSCPAANLQETGRVDRPEPRHCLDLRYHLAAVQRIHRTLAAEGNVAFLGFLDRELARRRRRALADLLAEAPPPSPPTPGGAFTAVNASPGGA